MFAQSHRVQNACRAESAVEEVNTAVNKLHAEVQVGKHGDMMHPVLHAWLIKG
jgi:hypothetical protein